MPMIVGDALTGLGLAGEIKAEAEANNPDLAAEWEYVTDDGQPSSNNMDWLFDAVAKAVIDHIKANELVTGTTTQASCVAGGSAGIFTSTSIT